MIERGSQSIDVRDRESFHVVAYAVIVAADLSSLRRAAAPAG
jgi:hypothetical protein